MLLIRSGLNQKELAQRMGVTQSTLSGKYKLDDWRESDLKEIARICGCEYKGCFKGEGWEI